MYCPQKLSDRTQYHCVISQWYLPKWDWKTPGNQKIDNDNKMHVWCFATVANKLYIQMSSLSEQDGAGKDFRDHWPQPSIL